MNVCAAIIVIFSDSVWYPAAQQLAQELRAPDVCIVHKSIWAHNTSVWGQPQYFERIRQRVPIVHDLLATLARSETRWIAMFDADIVVQRNVTARMTRTFRDTDAQLIVQQEWPCKTAPFRLCANGGLWAVRRSAHGMSLLERVAALMHRLRIPDQDAFDIVARGESVHYLDRQLYANGYTLQYDRQWRAASAHLVHVNWIQSTECKLRWLQQLRRSRFHSFVKYDGGAGAEQSRCGV